MQQKINTNRFTLLLRLVLLLSIALPYISYANKTNNETAKIQTEQQIQALTEYANQTTQQLKNLQNITQNMINSNVQEETLVTTFRILTGFTLTLLLLVLYIFPQKYARLLEKSNASLEKIKKNQDQHKITINKLKQHLQQTEEKTKNTYTTIDNTTQQLQQQLQTLQNNQKSNKSQTEIAHDILQKHLKAPLEQGISELDITTLKSLLNTGRLGFQDTLKTKALIAEHQQKWQHAQQLWETLLLETDNNNEVLLHIGYANYKQAAENSKNNDHLNKAVSIYDRIMVSAPEYFEDAYGYDDQTVGPEAIDTNAGELWIYQQLEELIIKTDELRNYQSILNIACQYAAAGQIDDARDCLERVSPVYHAASCKQLQTDPDLNAVRQLDWFQDIIKAACMINRVKKAEAEQHFQQKIA